MIILNLFWLHGKTDISTTSFILLSFAKKRSERALGKGLSALLASISLCNLHPALCRTTLPTSTRVGVGMWGLKICGYSFPPALAEGIKLPSKPPWWTVLDTELHDVQAVGWMQLPSHLCRGLSNQSCAHTGLVWDCCDVSQCATGGLYDGNEWKKYVVPRMHPLRPHVYAYFNRAESKGAFRLLGATRDHFRCTLEPSPGHVRCRPMGA